MDVVSVILKPVVEVLMVPVKEHLGCMISYKKYVIDMHTKMKDLDAARVGVELQKKQNVERCLEVPAQVSPWLIEVEQMNKKVEDFSSEILGCLDLKSRYKLGRKAFKIFSEIKSVLERRSLIQWTEVKIPPGRIDSMMASTSTLATDHGVFWSREKTFTEALEALGVGSKKGSHMVALCGMGGVGKTTMMKKLKQVVVEKKMFMYFVEAVIGEKTDPIAIQKAVAEYLGIELTEVTKPARAEKLRKWFATNSDGGKNMFLVILDDVWQPVDLEDIGLSPLPDQGVNFKVLITSRDQALCTQMGVEVDSILKVSVLEEAEAQSLFRQNLGSSDDVDPELHKIGEEIVRKCCGLPIAIKTMACTLRSKRKDTWKNALSRLKNHDIKTVAPTVFKTSYDNLNDMVAEATFLLCGLFPEDHNISTEDLFRYGWGLELFKGLGTIREARYNLNACIERLIHTNLLIESDNVGYVKMHDLVRAFVLAMFSKVEHASIVNHGSNRGWPVNDMNASCQRISLTCKGISEFPSELKFPSLSILKLIHGDDLLRFPRGFYGQMEKLRVISYDQMMCPLLPSSLECSTNLRVLRLHQCSMKYDFSSIGNLQNLEVLSFAYSDIESLPSTIGNLKKLRVLDVTGCGGLRIDSDILKKIVRLEELYAHSFDNKRAISFTGDNCNGVAGLWNNLSTLEFEFVNNDSQLMHLLFENLERFKISMGRSLGEVHDFEKRKHSVENMLKLVTKKGELSGSRINQLFEKTMVLYLTVDDMIALEDVGVKSSLRPQSSSFYNLRILVVSECAKLKYLFTLSVSKVLSNLEYLEVRKCLVMKELIHNESSGEERVSFPNLKSLSLCELPKLEGLCLNVNVIALPELVELKLKEIPTITSIYSNNKSATYCLLREEVLIPKLEKLYIDDMEDLKEIWPCEYRTNEEVKLREIEVRSCDNLVNLFPCNPMPLLHHLEELIILHCSSIEVLFNMDMDCVGESREGGGSNSLRSIKVAGLGKLQELWRVKGANHSRLPIRGFQDVRIIGIQGCWRFRNVFSPTTTNFDLGALINVDISYTGEIGRKHEGSVESSQGPEVNIISKEETIEIGDHSISCTPFGLIQSFHNLRKLRLKENEGMEVIFEIKCTQRSQERLFPYLEELNVESMGSMTRVWNCNWSQFLVLHKNPSVSPFHNLKTIYMCTCKSVKYLFSPLMARLLSNLNKVDIRDCDVIEEVVSHRDDGDDKKTRVISSSTHARTDLFPCLDVVYLHSLQNLKCFGGGGVAKSGINKISFDSTITTTAFLDRSKQLSQVDDGVSWTFSQYPRKIRISECGALSNVIPSYAAGQMIKLQVLKIYYCYGMKEVFETQGINKSVNNLKLPNLKKLHIIACGLLEHTFTFSILESLLQLQELNIEYCKAMKVIVKEEHDGEKTTSSKAVIFPSLKSIKLVGLVELVGFFLGTNEFQWLSLDDLVIKDCPQMKVFTAGWSTAPQLKFVQTNLGKHTPEPVFKCDVTTTTTGQHLEIPFPDLESTTSSCHAATTSKEINIWSFHNLIELDLESYIDHNKIIPSNVLLKLQNLEKIKVKDIYFLTEVFEPLEGKNSGFDESQTTVVKLPNLETLELGELVCLRHIWNSNRSTAFKFPHLTRVSIYDCFNLEHVFSGSMVGSLLQLQELQITFCYNMEAVFVTSSDDKMNEVVLPRLRSIKLKELSSLKGFCVGKADYSFPSLDAVTIYLCPKIETFTTGNSSTPDLKGIQTDFGSFDVEEDINSLIYMKQEEFRGSESSLVQEHLQRDREKGYIV